MSITHFLNSKGFYKFEGYSQEVSGQVKDLIEITKNGKIHVMEIGFNAGHSSEVFLLNNPELVLTSFDLGSHDYVPIAKEYIDMTFPNRHTLILGDSTVTVPLFIKKNPTTKFDIIFIDGGHEYEIAKKDIENCFHLAHKDTIVIIDDTMFTNGWEAGYTKGPTKVWTEKIAEKNIVELQHKDYIPGRGMSWGKYLL